MQALTALQRMIDDKARLAAALAAAPPAPDGSPAAEPAAALATEPSEGNLFEVIPAGPPPAAAQAAAEAAGAGAGAAGDLEDFIEELKDRVRVPRACPPARKAQACKAVEVTVCSAVAHAGCERCRCGGRRASARWSKWLGATPSSRIVRCRRPGVRQKPTGNRCPPPFPGFALFAALHLPPRVRAESREVGVQMSEMCEKTEQARLATVQQLVAERSSRMLAQHTLADLHAAMCPGAVDGAGVPVSERVRSVLASNTSKEQHGIVALEPDLLAAVDTQTQLAEQLEAARLSLEQLSTVAAPRCDPSPAEALRSACTERGGSAHGARGAAGRRPQSKVPRWRQTRRRYAPSRRSSQRCSSRRRSAPRR